MSKLSTRIGFITVLMSFLFVSQLFPQIPSITVDLSSESVGTVTPALLGINNPMTDIPLRTNYNSSTGKFNQEFYDNINLLGIKSMRFPGGNASGSYHWQNGIGPAAARPAGFNGSTGSQAAHYYQFGFLEFIDLMKDIGGSDPIICINFGTGSAEEASAWVEFANSTPGSDANSDGIDQAQRREDLGYSDPFQIRRWEIGNELGNPYKHMFSWHFGMKQNGGEDYRQTCRNYIQGGSQWQYHDMKTRQIGQRVVDFNDWSVPASKSNGSAYQSFFVMFPPVMQDSIFLGVWLDSLTVEQWQQVSDMRSHSGSDNVFTFTRESGEITFGDGTHGRIPPAGAEIRVIYKPEVRDGLIDFYEQMKTVDPTIAIGVPFHDVTFYDEMKGAEFSELPFDFIVDHTYKHPTSAPLEEDHWRLMWTSYDQEAAMMEHRQNLDARFGGQKNIKIAITEYNMVSSISGREAKTNNPWYNGQQLDYFGRSLDNGLYVAGALMVYLRVHEQAGLDVLNFHSLVPDDDNAVAGWQLSALMGPKPYRYMNPSGHVYSMLTQSYGYKIIETETVNFPSYRLNVDTTRDAAGKVFSQIDSVHLDYLETLAAVSETGDSLLLFVLNRASGLPEAAENHHDITANVIFRNSGAFSRFKITEFNGDGLWDINTVTDPENATASLVYKANFTDSLNYTFPAHSLTMILAYSSNTCMGELSGSKYPRTLQLDQNFPNPFNNSTCISYSLPRQIQVKLEILNVQGRVVNRLTDEFQNAGNYLVFWDGKDRTDQPVSSGVYFFRLTGGEKQMLIKKCILMK